MDILERITPCQSQIDSFPLTPSPSPIGRGELKEWTHFYSLIDWMMKTAIN